MVKSLKANSISYYSFGTIKIRAFYAIVEESGKMNLAIIFGIIIAIFIFLGGLEWISKQVGKQ